jgi:hypothetical protein
VREEEEDEAQVVAEKEVTAYKIMRERTKLQLWRIIE